MEGGTWKAETSSRKDEITAFDPLEPEGSGAQFVNDHPVRCGMFFAWAKLAGDILRGPVEVAGDARRQLLWTHKLRLLRAALTPDMADWPILLDARLLRAGRAVDAVILAPRCIVACTLRSGRRHAARDEAEDAALDLYDFHAGSRVHPVVPLLVTAQAPPGTSAWPLMLPGVTACQFANARTFGPLLRELAGLAPPGPSLDAESWSAAPYRPMPGLIEAACTLYARHGVADIAAAGAEAGSLHATHTVISDAIAAAAAYRRPTIVFVTGIPGAGKTLCGLNVALAGDARLATFLTGNPALVHVLREALARDPAPTRGALRAARQRMDSVIQALPTFRDSYAFAGAPPERVIVIDEAQRCWTQAHAVAKTAERRIALTQSEPAHLLDIMARRRDGPVIVCLVGGGQEIHDGEGGLAAWSAALQDRPDWQVHAPAAACATPTARQRLSTSIAVADDALHLTTSIRSLRSRDAPAWVDAVLAGERGRAQELAAQHAMPFTVVRDLAALRAGLRGLCRGTRRAGLVASSGARRLRAEGLGSVLPHDDPASVARWFLDRFPDIRASDALETAATEFFCQGLELDAAGLCWDGDLVWQAGAWTARAFRGSAWTRMGPEKSANRLNAYRVLLTRARYHMFIWVPRGDVADATRDPRRLDDTADFLLSCGAHPNMPPDPPGPHAVPVVPRPQDLFA